MSVDELYARVGSVENLRRLIAFYTLEPRGDRRSDLRAALQTWQLVTVQGAKHVKLADCSLGSLIDGREPLSPSEAAALHQRFVDEQNTKP